MSAVAEAPIRVEVVYAVPGRSWRVPVLLAPGATVAQALQAAALEALVPGIEVDPGRLAVFSRPVGPDDALAEGDRLEVLRPLLADPMEVRRRRARQR